MLASPPVRAAGDRIGPAVAALVVCSSALFFGNGLADAPLVWIGGRALVAGVALALWVAARSRVGGTVLLYLFVVTLLLTYSRFGVALACVVAAAYVWREPRRVESIATIVIGGVAGGGVFAVALALNGIT